MSPTERPQISIVLPSYNRADYLKQAIEGCLAQTYTNFELIIVDDCSEDKSFEIAKSYADQDSRIQVIRNENNKKLPTTLNIGFQKAKGQYLTWTSDDNLYHPQALEKMSSILDKMQDIGLAYADYTLIDQNGKIGKRLYQEPPEFLPIRDCVGACFLYRKEIADQVGPYNEQMFLVEDYEYWLRFGLVTKLFHIKESLYFYRVHEQSLTKTRKEEIRKAKNILKEIYTPKYTLSKDNQPIYDLYMWFISKKTYKSYLQLFKIILSHPFATLSYIWRNLTRL